MAEKQNGSKNPRFLVRLTYSKIRKAIISLLEMVAFSA